MQCSSHTKVIRILTLVYRLNGDLIGNMISTQNTLHTSQPMELSQVVLISLPATRYNYVIIAHWVRSSI